MRGRESFTPEQLGRFLGTAGMLTRLGLLAVVAIGCGGKDSKGDQQQQGEQQRAVMTALDCRLTNSANDIVFDGNRVPDETIRNAKEGDALDKARMVKVTTKSGNQVAVTFQAAKHNGALDLRLDSVNPPDIKGDWSAISGTTPLLGAENVAFFGVVQDKRLPRELQTVGEQRLAARGIHHPQYMVGAMCLKGVGVPPSAKPQPSKA